MVKKIKNWVYFHNFLAQTLYDVCAFESHTVIEFESKLTERVEGENQV